MKIDEFYCYVFIVAGLVFMANVSYLPDKVSVNDLKRISGYLDRKERSSPTDRGYTHFIPIKNSGGWYRFRVDARIGGREGKLETEIGKNRKVDVYYYDSCFINSFYDRCRLAFLIKSDDQEFIGYDEAYRNYYIRIGRMSHNASFSFSLLVILSGVLFLLYKRLMK